MKMFFLFDWRVMIVEERRALASKEDLVRSFWWNVSILIIYSKFLYEDSRSRSAPLLLENKHIENKNKVSPLFFTPQPNLPEVNTEAMRICA
jgi:hypothetical protein